MLHKQCRTLVQIVNLELRYVLVILAGKLADASERISSTVGVAIYSAVVLGFKNFGMVYG